MSVAIITPYYQESRPQLERCLASVRAQTSFNNPTLGPVSIPSLATSVTT